MNVLTGAKHIVTMFPIDMAMNQVSHDCFGLRHRYCSSTGQRTFRNEVEQDSWNPSIHPSG